MLSLGCERLPNPLKKKRKKKKVLDHYLHHDLGMLPLLRCFFCSFTHLTIPRSPPKFYSVLPCTTQDPSIKFHPNPFITFWVMLSTDKQTNRQTNQRYQKHNLLCQGGKNKWSIMTMTSLYIVYIYTNCILWTLSDNKVYLILSYGCICQKALQYSMGKDLIITYLARRLCFR